MEVKGLLFPVYKHNCRTSRSLLRLARMFGHNDLYEIERQAESIVKEGELREKKDLDRPIIFKEKNWRAVAAGGAAGYAAWGLAGTALYVLGADVGFLDSMTKVGLGVACSSPFIFDLPLYDARRAVKYISSREDVPYKTTETL
ncbi:MAG: hypothetical protein HY518_04070 [Candidatus Aenigmarchaeota archaeon]|nr:hypothetical protein [Candidatus Aenigmarchaeota archaeon]